MVSIVSVLLDLLLEIELLFWEKPEMYETILLSSETSSFTKLARFQVAQDLYDRFPHDCIVDNFLT